MSWRFLFTGFMLAALLSAQEKLSVVGPEPATLPLGDTARIQLTVEGRGADPRTPELPKIDGLQLQISAPSTRMFQSWDGRTQTQQYSVQFMLYLKPQRDGAFTIPPIKVWTGTREQQTPVLHLDVVKDIKGEEFGYLDVRVQPQRVYVHEPIRVRIEFGVEAGLRPVLDVVPGSRQRYVDYEVQAPWLTALDGAEILPVAEPQDGRIVVCNRTTQRADFDPDLVRGGKHYQSYVFERAFLPTRIGKLELSAPMLRYDVLLRQGRVGIFGEVVGGENKNYYVYGKPLAIEVLPIPEAGRPNPYYGAVGRFQIDAALDKAVVKRGSSVKLTLTVRGQGNMEFLRVPELDSLPGLHKLGQTEKRSADSVLVTYDLTPLDVNVHEVPAIEWNYFDTTPGVEKFVQVATRPLPLEVKPLEHGETLPPLPAAVTKAVTPGVDDVLDLRELTPGGEAVRGETPWWLPWLALLVPWLLVGGFVGLRAAARRRAADVLGARARGALRALDQALQQDTDPATALAQYLGDRLGLPAAATIGADLPARLGAAGVDAELAARVADSLEQGIAARYGGGGSLDAAAVRALARELEGRRLGGIGSKLPLWLLLLAVALPLPAQQGSKGTEAYRRGDYQAAIDAFQGAIAHSRDRRLYYDLGNSYYRKGDLPHALWAYECARLGMPRDPDLLANLKLVRNQLQLGDGGGQPFVRTVVQLLSYCTGTELVCICAALQLLAALLLVFGWRSLACRALGVLVLLPALALALELLWLQPARPRRGIALHEVAITAEPRKQAPVVATVQPGVELALEGGLAGSWLRVQIDGRKGYAPGAEVEEVR